MGRGIHSCLNTYPTTRTLQSYNTLLEMGSWGLTCAQGSVAVGDYVLCPHQDVRLIVAFCNKSFCSWWYWIDFHTHTHWRKSNGHHCKWHLAWLSWARGKECQSMPIACRTWHYNELCLNTVKAWIHPPVWIVPFLLSVFNTQDKNNASIHVLSYKTKVMQTHVLLNKVGAIREILHNNQGDI